ncbi:hypothetical protein EVAR_46020_1 [Eumeta japonica]|uniref:Uncharacterized protein n=1 Tax=Eumeta variegata TaxID=151549 RepID=A0A4C1Z825_EUMVA|nr:hypothetical protein EVAR_46020_1 [Eumeta japonica]
MLKHTLPTSSFLFNYTSSPARLPSAGRELPTIAVTNAMTMYGTHGLKCFPRHEESGLYRLKLKTDLVNSLAARIGPGPDRSGTYSLHLIIGSMDSCHRRDRGRPLRPGDIPQRGEREKEIYSLRVARHRGGLR